MSNTGCRRVEPNRAKTAFLLLVTMGIIASAACGPKKAPVTGEDLRPVDRAEAFYRQGQDLLEEGRVEEACRQFDRGLELDPYNAELNGSVAVCRALIGDYQRARAAARSARNLSRESAGSLIASGRVEALAGNHKKALEFYEKALKKTDAPRAQIHELMAEIKVDMQEYDKAEKHYAEVLEHDPRYLRAEQEWKRLQNMRRAGAISRLDRPGILLETVTFGELAVVAVADFDLDGVLARPKPSVLHKPDYSMPPDYVYSDRLKALWVKYPELRRHDFWPSLEKMFFLGAFTPMPDGSFDPDQTVSRLELAIITQEILYIKTGNPEIFYWFRDARSPFEDMDRHGRGFHATMLSVNRGFMDARPNGRFGPNEGVTFTDAILTFAYLRDWLVSN